MTSGQAELIAADVVAVAASMGAVYLAVPKPLPETAGKPTSVLEFVHTLWWYPFVFYLVVYAAIATYKLSKSPEARWTDTCPESYAFLRTYIAAQIVAIPVELSLPGAWPKKLQMVAHHVVSVSGYAVGLLTPTCHFFGTAAGLSEISTIFLEGLLLSKHVALENFFAARAPWFLVVNGAGLWLSFILFRLVLFPAIVAVFFHDLFFYPELTWRKTGSVKYWIPPMLAFLFVLSAVWFQKIHKGFMTKVLSALRPADKKLE
ncbi:hypothetical protein CTAYLR_008042 [Chrysophaeum taylorii]|uniref:TLC domain-containing protein n=1 Tax=Chrysophaeum taylorii TaxID=2483200 RepID=A0AAD7U9G0_9STRA|nr:hypothetical protein CTAYLR_008042 [Chrysophaeum taylorii]